MKYIFAILSFLAITTPAMADSEFCAGFEMGYKTIKGNDVFMPPCPFEPMTPFGSTPYQEGIKAGMAAANE